jgi:hypothetical protein
VLCARADALCRAAAEACRQHARYARLVAIDACDAEQRAACKVIGICDELLGELAESYAKAAAQPADREAPFGASGDGIATGGDGWHEANMLLLAAREYLRHQIRCDRASRRPNGQTPEALEELTTEYELGASALLALQQAVESYRRARPEPVAARANGGGA